MHTFVKYYSIIFLIITSTAIQGMQNTKSSWQVVYNEEANEYIGKKVKWPQVTDNFKYFIIHVSKEDAREYSGYAINDYCDGNHRQISNDSAEYYFAKFKAIYDKSKIK